MDAQRPVSQMVLDSVKLTININHCLHILGSLNGKADYLKKKYYLSR